MKELEKLFLRCGRKTVYRPKMTVLTQRQNNLVCYVARGKVYLAAYDYDRECFLYEVCEGELFSSDDLLNRDERKFVDFYFLTSLPSEIYTMPKGRFTQESLKNTNLILETAKCLSEKLRFSTKIQVDLGLNVRSEDRIWEYFKYRYRRSDAMTHPDGMVVRVSITEISKILLLHRSLVGIKVNSLIEAGRLAREPHIRFGLLVKRDAVENDK